MLARQCAVKQYQNAEDTRGRLVMSCMTPASDGTFISIDDGEAKQFRESVVEWLMTNHPHDCPVCEEGGNCHLQDMTVMTGHSFRRYRFTKRTPPQSGSGAVYFARNEPLHRLLPLRALLQRLCRRHRPGRLWRARQRLLRSPGRWHPGKRVLRQPWWKSARPASSPDKTHSERYNRKWDMQFAPSICQQCSIGCNISPGERYGELRRIENRYNGTR